MLRLPTTIHLPILYGKVDVNAMSNEELVEQIKNGYHVTENMQVLYENNLPLIKKFIKPYAYYEPEEDLLQETYFGLWEAVRHYERSENVLFMTYAQYWVKQSVQRYLENSGSILRISSAYRQKIARYKKSVQEYEQLYNRNPSDLDMCKYMNVSLEQIEKLKIWMQDVKSLDDTISCNGDSFTIADTIADDFSIEDSVIDDQYKIYEQQTLWEIVDKHVDSEQQSVIKKIYKENKTFKEISQENKISVDEVRKIKETGLKKLRSPKAIKEIREKLEMLEESSIMYQSGINSFNNKGMSNTEYLAIKKATLKKFLE